MIDETELSKVIKLYPILQELPPEMQRTFYASGFAFRLQAGETAIEPGCPLEYFYFLTSGSLRVVRSGHTREMLLYRVLPGETCTLSICHLTADLPFQARAIAESPSTGVAIPRRLFTQLVERAPLFSVFLFRSLSERINNLLELVESVSLTTWINAWLEY